MKSVIIKHNKRTVTVHCQGGISDIEPLMRKIKEMDYDLSFRQKWKKVLSVHLINEVAIFNYNDGTKLYLQVA